MPPPNLFGAAVRYRDLVVAQLAAAGRPPLSRVYIADGGVAVDCEQLAIEVEFAGIGQPGAPSTAPVRPGTDTWYATLVGWITRCAPPSDSRGNAPSAAKIEAAAEAILGDGAVLLEAARLLTDSCQAVAVLGLTFPGPSGGYDVAHCRIQVTP